MSRIFENLDVIKRSSILPYARTQLEILLGNRRDDVRSELYEHVWFFFDYINCFLPTEKLERRDDFNITVPPLSIEDLEDNVLLVERATRGTRLRILIIMPYSIALKIGTNG